MAGMRFWNKARDPMLDPAKPTAKERRKLFYNKMLGLPKRVMPKTLKFTVVGTGVLTATNTIKYNTYNGWNFGDSIAGAFKDTYHFFGGIATFLADYPVLTLGLIAWYIAGKKNEK